MGTIKIGSSKEQKGIEINPNVVLFNGNNVKKIIRGETEIWGSDVESIALVPTLTSNNGSDGGYAFQSNTHNSGNYPVWKAFDGNTYEDYMWHSADYATTGYIGYKFTVPTCVKKFSLTNRYTGSHAPREMMLMASNDGSTWEAVSKTLYNTDGAHLTNWFEIDNNKYYLFYRLYIFSSYGSSIVINELQFYGSQLN